MRRAQARDHMRLKTWQRIAPAALPVRARVAWVVVQFGHEICKLGPRGALGQDALGDLILRFHIRLCLGAVWVLQPPVGVRNLEPMQVIHDTVVSPYLRVRDIWSTFSKFQCRCSIQLNIYVGCLLLDSLPG